MPYPLSLEQRAQHVRRYEVRAVTDSADTGLSSATEATTQAATTDAPTTSNPPSSTPASVSPTQSPQSQSQLQATSPSVTKTASSVNQTVSSSSNAFTSSTASQPTQTQQSTQNTPTATQSTASFTSTTNNIVRPTTMTGMTTATPNYGSSISVGRLTSDGQVWTVTNVVSNAGPTGFRGSDSTSHGFLSNKGGVAAVLVLASLAGTALILVAVMQIMKRHRRRQFEREVAMAARHPRKPPSFDEDDGSYPQMAQASSATKPLTAYPQQPPAGTATAYGAPTVEADPNEPESSDYYNAQPYNGPGGYPSQPVPIYSGSSQGHEQGGGHNFSQAYYDNSAVAYGQAYGHPYGHPDAYNGGYPQQGGYTAGGYDAFGQHPQQAYAYSEPAQAQPVQDQHPAAGQQYAGRNLTPADAARPNVGRKSLVDDTSAKSFYLDDEPQMPAPRELRVANE